MLKASIKVFISILLSILLVLFSFQSATSSVKADEIEDLQKQIDSLKNELTKVVADTKANESRLVSLKRQLTQIQENLVTLDKNIVQKEKELKDRETALSSQQELLEKRVRTYYIRSFLTSPFILILSSQNPLGIFKDLTYRIATAKEDQRVIKGITEEITDLKNQKSKLEKDKASLAGLKAQTNQNATSLDSQIKKAKIHQTNLSNQIASLSAKQQAILAARSGSFTFSLGDSMLADDYYASIQGFREKAPAGSFAAFSFGAHTHRKGMSQYGARGRVSQGQTYKQILAAYYGKEPVTKDTSGTISVTGFGNLDFETTYLYGIAEMPSSWPVEALKAQAVAARTYAYRYKVEGKEICTTEACQVFNKSKSDSVPASWRQAVDETKGQILEGVVTYYSSTTGGFLTTMGWDTTDGKGGSNFIDKSYEKLGGSPWLYKAWYTQGYSSSSDKCGRSNPWLNSTELADIVNAYFVMYGEGTGADTSKVTPVTTSCWGGNPYTHDELRAVSANYGGGISSISNVYVLQGDGVTNEVVVLADKGEERLNGTKFKTVFNLRAPGYLQIPQNGFAFYNIEKK